MQPNQTLSLSPTTPKFETITDTADRLRLQEDLSEMSGWSKGWLLKFHQNKYKVMHINNKKTDHWISTD